MSRNKIILGLALATSLASFTPVADAAPIAASRAAVTMSSSDGAAMDVVRVSTHPTRRHRHRKSHHGHHHHHHH
jgi:uncharacterized protein involved in copper resistance